MRKALAEQGFGIMAEIDVATTLKNKIGAEIPATVILGACNPPLAHRALTAVPDVSVLLPCNVVVREKDGRIEVAAINPLVMVSVFRDNAELLAVAQEADSRIRKAMKTLE
ncbi:MAG: DUF302 domain-containing protein [Magnetococcales bacterium]|nr:DUF302 domain-containing protein [Magnetococcales bacterium]